MRFFRFIKSRFNLALVLLLILLVGGTLGYRFLTNATWIEALYMTVITVTTVGYGESVPMDMYARLFTIGLILSSVVVVGYALGVITEYLLQKASKDRLREREFKNRMKNMENHIIVCGYGRNGAQAVETLSNYDQQILVLDTSEDVINTATMPNTIFRVGDATQDEVLQEAGIERAHSLICALSEDADNLFVVLSARQLAPKLKIISRASQEGSQRKLKLAGADSVVMPDRIGGDHMASLVVNQDLVEFIENLKVSGSSGVNMEEVAFRNIFEDRERCTIREVDLRGNTGCSIIGYKGPNGEYHINPDPDTAIERGSKLVVIGRPEQIKSLRRFYKLDS